jgi:hypothetical protein
MLPRMRTTLLALTLLLSLAPRAARAQEPEKLDLAKLPKEGSKPEDFVPAGWKLEASVRGDLDKNGSEDVALQLIQAAPPPGGEEQSGEPERTRGLVVLLSGEGGKLRRAAASNRLLYCTACVGTMGGGEGGVLKIEKGVLLVDQMSGSREVMRTLLRFRHDAKDGRFVLIGMDVTNTDRLTGASTLESTNLLNGAKVIEKRQYDQKKDKDVVRSSKKEKVAVKKRYLEDVDIENL